MLEIKDLNFSYGEKKIFSDFSISVPDSGIYVLMGPSGCGKSTLFSLIAGFLKSDSGSIKNDAEKPAFSFQEPRLIPSENALDNVNFVLGGKKETLEKAAGVLSELGLSDALYKYPSELSGGMQKRVSLARALAYDGDFLLLDEPLTGLDGEIKEKILSKIKEIGKRVPILMITHDKEEAAVSDMIFDFEKCNRL